MQKVYFLSTCIGWRASVAWRHFRSTLILWSLSYQSTTTAAIRSNSLTLSNEGELFWSWIPKNHILKFRKLKKISSSLFYVLHKTLNKVFPHRSHKKVCCPRRVVVFAKQTYLFLLTFKPDRDQTIPTTLPPAISWWSPCPGEVDSV